MLDASTGVCHPQPSAPCITGPGFPSHGQGPFSVKHGRPSELPPSGLCAVILRALANSRQSSLALGASASASDGCVRLLPQANTPENVFLWCIIRGLANSDHCTGRHARASHIVEISVSNNVGKDHGGRRLGDVGFTAAFSSNSQRSFFLHVYGYHDHQIKHWSSVDALYLALPHTAQGACCPVVWAGQSHGQVVTPLSWSFSGVLGHVDARR